MTYFEMVEAAVKERGLRGEEESFVVLGVMADSCPGDFFAGGPRKPECDSRCGECWLNEYWDEDGPLECICEFLLLLWLLARRAASAAGGWMRRMRDGGV